MTPEMALELGKNTLWTGLLLAGPALIVALAVGLLTALLQAITSIRDMTLGMVLKIVGVGLTLLLFGGWMLQTAVSFCQQIFNQMLVVVS